MPRLVAALQSKVEQVSKSFGRDRVQKEARAHFGEPLAPLARLWVSTTCP